MRVVTWNIHSGIGVDGVLSVRRIAEVIASLDPDMVGLNEVRAVPPFLHEARALGRMLGMRYVFQRNLNRFRFRFGNAVFTRHELIGSTSIALPGNGEPRGLLLTRVAVGGEEVTFGSTHLALDTPSRELQKAAILAALPGDVPTVIAGDFNELPEGLGALARRLQLAEPRPSFQAPEPWAAIDFVLASPHWRIERTFTETSGASDHLPVVADLVLGSGT
jgi:endonuclease/exonuclease/phosphatase family metal-dependent hydrolase